MYNLVNGLANRFTIIKQVLMKLSQCFRLFYRDEGVWLMPREKNSPYHKKKHYKMFNVKKCLIALFVKKNFFLNVGI